jgi:hypothetical protein
VNELLEQIRDELRRLRELAEGDHAEAAPVVGARAAARILRVGERQVVAAIDELEDGDPRRPIAVTVRGGGQGPWWESRDSVVTWWRELHRPTASSSSPKRRKSPAPTVALMTTEEFHRRLKGVRD